MAGWVEALGAVHNRGAGLEREKQSLVYISGMVHLYEGREDDVIPCQQAVWSCSRH